MIRDLGTLGGPESEAAAINDHGQIVGWADTKRRDEDGKPISHVFLWRDGKLRDLGTFVLPDDPLDAINERGQIVGRANTRRKDENGEPIWRAFLWQDGKLRDLGTLGGSSSDGWRINDRGQVVGWADTTAEDVDGLSKYPWRPDPRWEGAVCFKGTADPRQIYVPWAWEGGDLCLDYGDFVVFGDPELLREVRAILDAEGFQPASGP